MGCAWHMFDCTPLAIETYSSQDGYQAGVYTGAVRLKAVEHEIFAACFYLRAFWTFSQSLAQCFRLHFFMEGYALGGLHAPQHS